MTRDVIPRGTRDLDSSPAKRDQNDEGAGQIKDQKGVHKWDGDTNATNYIRIIRIKVSDTNATNYIRIIRIKVSDPNTILLRNGLRTDRQISDLNYPKMIWVIRMPFGSFGLQVTGSIPLQSY